MFFLSERSSGLLFVSGASFTQRELQKVCASLLQPPALCRSSAAGAAVLRHFMACR